MSEAAALFIISALVLLSPVNACFGVGCDDDVAVAVGLGVAARVGIAIAVIAVVAVVLILILRRRKQQQMAAQQQNGMRPYDLEGGNLPAAEVNASQSTVNNAYRYKTSMDSVPI